MKVLLIGKSGQLGGELLKLAPQKGFGVCAYGHEELEVRDYEVLRERVKSVRPEFIVNTAAFHAAAACENNPAEALAVNCLAVRNLAAISKEYGAKFLTFSTDYVFDGEKGAPYVEDDSPRPLQFYGVSKLCGEYASMDVFPEGTYIIRTSGLFGVVGSKSKPGGNLVLQMLNAANSKDTVEISKEQIVSPTFAGDLALASLELLQRSPNPGIYHLVNEGHCSWAEFVEKIFSTRNLNMKVVPVDRGGAYEGIRRPKFSALQNIKAAALGIKLPSWEEGLAAYLKFLET